MAFLEEEVNTQYDRASFLQDPSGVDALLTGAYARSRIIAYDQRNYTCLLNEFCTDVSFETGGGLEAVAAPYIQFTWPVNNGILNGQWNKMYAAIASANTVLSVTDDLQDLPENEIRNRANVSEVSLGEYSTKEEIRDFILEERGREFFSEGLRREDLIRHGKFISSARSRGYNALAHQALYPIPLQQIDTNPNLEQNPGY
ncbi:MAG: RagB/SusD family nutrient uptake outer membrane protein [Cyclobacteriaceae bacterium]